MLLKPVKPKKMQRKNDWHKNVLIKLMQAPILPTRLGPAYTSIGHLLKFDLSRNGFPATQAKKLMFDQVKRELYCFLKGYTSKADLHEHGVKIWDNDFEKTGLNDLGRVYGWQWRFWEGWHDQLGAAVRELKMNKYTRRAIVSAWNPADFMNYPIVLPPCHVMFQFNICGRILYTDVYQRSADAFLGLPFDVACFAVINKLMLNELNMSEGFLNYHISNLHLYTAHGDAAREEISNQEGRDHVRLVCKQGFDNFHYNTCWLENYNETRIIKAPLL